MQRHQIPTPSAQEPHSWQARALAEGLIVIVVIAWWLLSRTLPDFVLPGPVAVAKQMWAMFTEPVYAGHVFVSVLRVIVAVVSAVILGTLLAFIPRIWPVADAIVHERIKPILNAFPSVGWAILATIWFGPSGTTIIFIMVMILIPFCLVNISEGLKEIDAELIEMARSFTRRPFAIFFKVTLPLLMPYVVASIRIAYGVGWKIALVAELFGSQSGLGFVLQQAQNVADATTVFATCLSIVLLFWLGERCLINPLANRYRHV